MSSEKPDQGDAKTPAAESVPDFPVAAVTKTASASVKEVFDSSRMWWVAVACLVVAVGLTWFAMPRTGEQVLIHFPEGHGLRPDDSVRHRGIEVGRVTSVELNPDLTGVDVTVMLDPNAENLAREGTRFWIVRPQLSLTAVTGLDTAVGSKYIAVSPADTAEPPRYEFDGLASAPPDDLAADQVQVVLRGDERHSLNAGSPLTWRGVEVGQVLSVHLSPDARYVDVVVGMNNEYRKLLRSNSKFWVTSGVDLDVGLKGIKIDAESLDTIARGGVAFITPGTAEGSDDIPAGHIFHLHEKADDSWITAADSSQLVDVKLPPTVAMRAMWKTKMLGISRSKERSFTGLVVSENGALTVIVPVDGVDPPEKAVEDSFSLTAGAPGGATVKWDLSGAARDVAGPGLVRISLKDLPALPQSADARMLRPPEGPEECCAVQSVSSERGVSSMIESIGRHEMRNAGDVWYLDLEHGDMQKWHGSPVVSLLDGKIIGVLLSNEQGTTIAPLARQP